MQAKVVRRVNTRMMLNKKTKSSASSDESEYENDD